MQFSKEEILELTTTNAGKFGCLTLEEAYNFCRSIAISHYENFPVASLLIPKRFRKHISAIYSFARIADDIADELIDEPAELRVSALNEMVELLSINYHSESYLGKKNPVFFALIDTMNQYSLPKSLFERLIEAFKQDVKFVQLENLQDLLLYCNNSANPIGELVLRLFKIDNEKVITYSDDICTALQLINFWQDISIDKEKKRCYIPKDLLKKYNLDNESLYSAEPTDRRKKLLDELFNKTQAILDKGKPLIRELKPIRLKLEIKATILSGERILKKIRKIGEKIIYLKIKLNIFDLSILIFKTLFSKVK